MKKENQKGFTLVELLVVISIIATLLAVLLPNFMGARERARDSQRVQDLSSIKNALRMYYNDHQIYPGTDASEDAVQPYNITEDVRKYFPQIDATDTVYTYYREDNGDSFRLCTDLEAGAGDEDVNSQKKCGIFDGPHCGLSVGTTGDKIFEVCAK